MTHSTFVFGEQMPKILRQKINVHIIQSRSHILNGYSEKISEYAEVNPLVSLRLAFLLPIANFDPPMAG